MERCLRLEVRGEDFLVGWICLRAASLPSSSIGWRNEIGGAICCYHPRLLKVSNLLRFAILRVHSPKREAPVAIRHRAQSNEGLPSTKGTLVYYEIFESLARVETACCWPYKSSVSKTKPYSCREDLDELVESRGNEYTSRHIL
jgi:hypothetical protein